MQAKQLCNLFGKLLLAILAFPPIYIVLKYLRWCGKQERDCDLSCEDNK